MNYNTSVTQAQLSKLWSSIEKVFCCQCHYIYIYNNRMSIEEVVMNMTNGCHMTLQTIFFLKNTFGANENLDLVLSNQMFTKIFSSKNV